MDNNGALRGVFMKVKKILSLLLSVSLLAMSFVGCGKNETNGDNDEMKMQSLGKNNYFIVWLIEFV